MSFGGASLGSAEGRVIIDISQATGALTSLEGSLAKADGAGANAFGGATKSATAFTKTVNVAGAAVGGFLLGSIKTAADFEFRMSAIQSVLGATDAEAAGLRETILDIGKSSAFTTGEVAKTAEELAKLGLTGEVIQNGALKAVTDLAAATETSPVVAGNIIGAAINQYQLAGEDAERVADLFTRAANQSAADVSSLGEAFTYVAGLAKQLGVPIEDLVVGIEALNDRGIQGTMAGTGLRQVLTSIINPTKEAAALMEQYGIAVKDANGEFVGMPKLLDNINDSLSDLTNAQKAEVLNQIFGDRGGNAILALLDSVSEGAKEAGKSWEDYAAGLEEGATASDQAADRLDNLKGSLEKLRGAFDVIKIKFGTPFLAGLKAFVDGLTFALDRLGNMPDRIAAIIAGILAPLATLGSLRFAGGLARNPLFSLIPGFNGIAAAAARAAGPIAILVAAIEALGFAYKHNLFGFADAVNSVAGAFKTFGKVVGPAVTLIKALAGTGFGAGQLFQGQTKDLIEFQRQLQALGVDPQTAQLLRNTFTGLALPIRRIRNLTVDAAKSAKLMFGVLTGNTSQKALDELKSRLQRVFGEDVGKDLFQATRKLRASMKRFGDALGKELGIKNPFETLSPENLMKQLPTLGKRLNKLVSQFKKDVLPVVGRGLNQAFRLGAAGLDFLTKHMDQVGTVVRSLATLAFGPLLTVLKALGALLRGDFRGALDAVKDGVSNALGAVGDLLGVGADILRNIDWGGIASGINQAILDAIGVQSWDQVWTAIKFLIEEKAPEALGIAKDMAIDFAVHVGKVAWGAAKDFAGMVADFLRGGTVGDGTGGPETDKPPIDPIGITLDFLATIGDLLWDGAKDVGGAIANAIITYGPVVAKATVNLAVTLGGILWDGVVSLGGALASKVGAGINALPNAIKVVANVAGEIGGILWDGVVGIAGAIKNKIGIAATHLPEALSATADIAGTIGETLFDGVKDIATAIKNKIGDIPPITGLIAEIAPYLVPGETITSFIADASSTVADWLGWAGDKTVEVGNLLVNPQSIELADDGEGGGSFVGSLVSSIADAIVTSLDAIGRGTVTAGSALGGALADLGRGLANLVIAGITFRADQKQAFDLGQRIGEFMADALRLAFVAPVEAPGAINDVISPVISNLSGAILEAIGKALIAIPFATGAVALSLANLSIQFMNLIIAAFAGIAVGIQDEFAPNADEFASSALGMVEGIVSAIISALGSVKASDIPGDLLSAVGSAITGLISDILNSIFGGGGDSASTNGIRALMTPEALKKSAPVDGLGTGLVLAIGQSIIDALGGGGAALATIKEQIKEKLKGLLNEIIDSLPGPDFLKDRLRDVLGLGGGGGSDPFEEAAKKLEGGAKKLRDKFNEKDLWPTEAPPIALPDDPVNDQADALLRRVGLDDGTVTTVISKAQAAAGKLAAGLQAAASSSRAKLSDDLIGGGRAKLPEIDTSGAPKVIPPPDTSAFQAAIAGLAAVVASTLATTVQQAGLSGNIIVNVLTNAMTQVVAAVSAAFGQVPGIISGALSGAASTAYAQGVNIGASLASGMISQIGAVTAAGNALASAAESSVATRAKIASPSKVMRGLGQFITQGLALGMLDLIGMVYKAGTLLATAAVPSDPAVANAAAATARAGQTIGSAAQPAGSTTIRNYRVDATIDPTAVRTVNDMVRYLSAFENSADIVSRPGRVRRK